MLYALFVNPCVHTPKHFFIYHRWTLYPSVWGRVMYRGTDLNHILCLGTKSGLSNRNIPPREHHSVFLQFNTANRGGSFCCESQQRDFNLYAVKYEQRYFFAFCCHPGHSRFSLIFTPSKYDVAATASDILAQENEPAPAIVLCSLDLPLRQIPLNPTCGRVLRRAEPFSPQKILVREH